VRPEEEVGTEERAWYTWTFRSSCVGGVGFLERSGVCGSQYVFMEKHVGNFGDMTTRIAPL